METQTLRIEGMPMAKDGAIEIQNVPINKIKIGRNSRMTVTHEELAGLMQSIKETGLLQPIGLVKQGDHYEICYGNRRFLATSKLGLTKIPAIIHESKKKSDVDMKNLTENIQRRNISLSEAGRYIELLSENGMTPKEIAIRLGVTDSYVDQCIYAYSKIPKEFRKDLEFVVGNARPSPGKISMSTAVAIVNAGKSRGISIQEQKVLLTAAKTDGRFKKTEITAYVNAARKGAKDPIASGKKNKPIHVNVNLWLTTEEHERLSKKYVYDGPFGTVSALCRAILCGEKSERISVIKGRAESAEK